MNRIVQVLGSVRIFTPFIAAQRGWVTMASNADLTRNFVGASVLTVLVGHERQYCGQSRRRMNCCGPLDRPRRGSFSTDSYRRTMDASERGALGFWAHSWQCRGG